MPQTEVPSKRGVSAGYCVGVYVYEYEAKSKGEGAFVARGERPASMHVQRAGLSSLGRLP